MVNMEKADQINTTANIIQTVFLALIVPVIAWLAVSDKQQSQSIAVLEHVTAGVSRYTREMAMHDMEPIVEKVNDHELRLRKAGY